MYLLARTGEMLLRLHAMKLNGLPVDLLRQFAARPEWGTLRDPFQASRP